MINNMWRKNRRRGIKGEVPLFQQHPRIAELTGTIGPETTSPLLEFAQSLGNSAVAESTVGNWTMLATGIIVLPIAINEGYSAQLNALINQEVAAEILGHDPRRDFHSHRHDAMSMYYGPGDLTQRYERGSVIHSETHDLDLMENVENDYYLTANVTSPRNRNDGYTTVPIGPVAIGELSETLRVSGSIETFNSHEMHRDATVANIDADQVGFTLHVKTVGSPENWRMSSQNGLVDIKGYPESAAAELAQRFGTNQEPSHGSTDYPVITSIVSPGADPPDLESMNPMQIGDRDLCLWLAKQVAHTARDCAIGIRCRPMATFVDDGSDVILRLSNMHS